uniref:WW domain-containing oxidoreductase n=1 Tax=Plectus sambesii TaxID=2011161 RepID=A0A914XPP2_9BILA
MSKDGGRALPPRPRKGSTALQVLKGIDLSGVFILITGANTGIGLETARALALHNAHVTLACRNMDAAERVKAAIKGEKADASVATIQLDLAELQSVERCASEYLASGKPLHVLILNAGVYNPQERTTKNGFETTFQVNHLAQFHLTNLLMERLLGSSPSRVVVVASTGHQLTTIPSDQNRWWDYFSPNETNMTNMNTAYTVSKLANVLFASELDRRMRDKGVRAFSVHPGVIITDITRNAAHCKALFTCCGCATISTEQGAATTVYCATAEGLELVGGQYFDQLVMKRPSRSARNEVNWTPFWLLSERMIDKYRSTRMSAV